MQIEVTWYVPQDLPSILLPSTAKPRPPVPKPTVAEEPKPKVSADAYHPRQTILSIPVRVTHPRQTLVEPDAPPTPPKVVSPLPNIVQWPNEERPKLQLPLSATNARPTIRHAAAKDVAAPELANATSPELPSPTVSKPQLRIPIRGGSGPAPRRSQTQSDAAAPEVGAASTESDPGLQRLIALSATPAPPAPKVSVPQGNLAARISISPDGPKAGTSGGAEGRLAIVASSGEGAGSSGGGSLPVAVSVSGGGTPAKSGGIGPAGSHSGNLALKPMARYDPPGASSEPARVAAIDPSLPPEKILSGKEVYTLHVNLPNITSVTGSWILSFAQLDEDPRPPFRPKGVLAGPVAYEKVDPKYPPGLIKAHVQGEVVLYAIIRKDGSVDSVQLVRGVDPELDRCAMDALAQWKFRPGTRAGVPVDLEAVVHVPFLYKSPQY